jgi:hypothetical protein
LNKYSESYYAKSVSQLNAGFFGSTEKYDVDGFRVGAKNPAFADERSEEDKHAERVGALARHRLVKAAKCPTQGETVKIAGVKTTKAQIEANKKLAFFAANSNRKLFNETALSAGYAESGLGVLWAVYDKFDKAEAVPVVEIEPPQEKRKIDCVGSKTVIEHRAWCDEYRIRTKTELANSSQPPEQSGKRKTKTLSLSGARSISDACYYVASDKKRGGFSTFLTLTLDDAARKRVASEETTVQKEISRFFDAIQKTYQRGWVHTFENKNNVECKKGASQKGVEYRCEGHSDKLDYVWVVENPKNEDGEDNPHAHIMLRWRVPFSHFGAWAERIESIWGQGFATLEKIKEPEKAGSYIAKAAGYMTKGSESDQGEVRGNRYGMSKTARAPAWEVYGIYENGVMGSLVTDVYDHFMCEHGTKLQKRNFLKEKLEGLPKSETNKKERAKIGAALEKIRAELNSDEVPHRPSKYQLVIKGGVHFKDFILWAQDKLYQHNTPSWLPDLKDVPWQADKKPDGPWLAEFKRRIYSGRVWRWFKQAQTSLSLEQLTAEADLFNEQHGDKFEDLSIDDFCIA